MTEHTHTYAVIMAGGGGTRLWPISRRRNPKQMIPLIDERSLFQTTVERLDGLFPKERILVVTVEEQAQALKEQAPSIPGENFILEPKSRGTASVVGLAAAVLRKRDPLPIMVVLPSDHYIRNRDLFYLILRVALDVAEKDYLVTLGITPTYPSTVYGYIQRGEMLPEKFAYPAYHALKFKEKPEEAQAREMMVSGDHSWNSGIFVWRVDAILTEFSRQMPDLHTALTKIEAAWGTDQQETVLKAVWPALQNETIDYGVMERAEKVAVLPAGGLEWSDIGNWNSLFDVLLPDEHGNIVFGGHHLSYDTSNSLIYDKSDGRLIVTIGVNDLIIVDTEDALLISRKDQSAKVKQIVSDLKKTDRENLT